MEWFAGTVTDALACYQEKQGVLIVYISNEEAVSEATAEFNRLWEAFDRDAIASLPYVALKLVAGSEGANQFAEFFPTPMFPVCYIIGLGGQPLEVITTAEKLTLERFNASLRKGVNLYRDQLKEQGVTSGAGAAAAERRAAGSPEGGDMTLEERVEYARRRLEEKRKADAAKKEEEQRAKELHRRNEGRALLELKAKNEEREVREAAEARRRQKEEDAAALKRLREQIQADKEERATRHARPAGEPQTSRPDACVNRPVDVDQCRVQCKFPDGSTLVRAFPADSALQAVVDAVVADGRQPTPFFIVQPYPRRQLTDMAQTLFQLGLTPSSSLLVIPADGASPSRGAVLPASGGYASLLLGFLYAPLLALYTLVVGVVGNLRGGPNQPPPPPAGGQQGGAEKKAGQAGERRVHRQGNVGRLHDESHSSSDEGTWNGNSTQQL